MTLDKHFNLKRFFNYLKYDFTLHGKTYLFFCIGLAIALFFIDFFTLSTASSRVGFLKGYYLAVFLLMLLISGVLAIGTSFPSFRKKESTSNYLLLPATTFEKYLVAFLVRVIGFFLVFLPLFWIVFKLAYAVYNLFEWKDALQLESFGLFSPFHFLEITLDKFAVFFGILSLASFMFMGAAYFKKYALFKTILAFCLLLLSFVLFSVLLSHVFLPEEVKGFDIKTFNRRINEDLISPQLYIYIFGIGASFFLLPLGYFKLKEKEL